MGGRNLVAVYATHDQAERARTRLREFGLSDKESRLSSDQATDSKSDAGELHREPGSFIALFGSDIPQEDRTWHGLNLREGRTAVSVHIPGDVDSERVTQILEQFDPIEIGGDAASLTAAPQIPLGGSGARAFQALPTGIPE
jgi:hypothetical protein